MFFNYVSVLSPFFILRLVLGSATGPLSIEAELASLASYSSLGLDSSIAEFEMTKKHAQRQCGRFGKKLVISSKITLAFCHISVLERVNLPLPATSIGYLRNDKET